MNFKHTPRCNSCKSPNYIQNSTRVLGQNVLKCFCKEIGPIKRLDMCRKVVLEKIRRPLEAWDIPVLLIFLKNNPDIISINLAYNNITDSGFKNLIDHSILYGNIRELNVESNYITIRGINYMYEVAEKLKIASLRLNGNKFGVEASKKLALFLLKNRYTRSLEVAEVHQTASSLVYFVMVLSTEQDLANETLKILDISKPNPGCMHFVDTEHLASIIGHMLKFNKCLEELRLQKYGFFCHDIEAMMLYASHNCTLRLLDLGCNNVGDHGVQHLANWLVKRPALRTLLLRRNIITNHGARTLSFSVPFSRLTSLDVSYNRITDDGLIDILNTLKKSPLMKYLRVFGNCLGHSSALVVQRMLVSKVLVQENIDVKPYRVDHKWYFAEYRVIERDKEYYDVPYSYSKPVSVVSRKIHLKKKYVKYVYVKTSDVETKQSDSTIFSASTKKCQCCFCLQCEDCCTCCKCKGDESSGSQSLDIACTSESRERIEYILNRVNSQTGQKILRWIDMDENVLNEDLRTIEGSTTESKQSCDCWVPFSVSMLMEYLNGVSIEDLLKSRKENSETHVKDESCSSLQYCFNNL